MKEYGFAAAKEAKAEKRQAAVASGCTCAANAPLVAAITELATYYFKDGNGNAGGTYTKGMYLELKAPLLILRTQTSSY